MMRFWMATLCFVAAQHAHSETYPLACETIGYASSAEQKVFYHSRKVGFWYESTERCTFSGPKHHALAAWRAFFRSEVADSADYDVYVKTDCGCYGEYASGVTRQFQGVKAQSVSWGYEVRRLKGFDVDNNRINSSAPSGGVLLEY